jgi:hypothetical protein
MISNASLAAFSAAALATPAAGLADPVLLSGSRRSAASVQRVATAPDIDRLKDTAGLPDRSLQRGSLLDRSV